MNEINCSSQDSYDMHGRWINKEDWDAQKELTQPESIIARLWNKLRNKR